MPTPAPKESAFTIVMYHYVRDLPRTRYPRIKGLLTGKFEEQLEYISRNYSVCSLAEVRAALRGVSDLPPNACVLTFDDGLADHYHTVLPRLLDRGFQGAFFPCARPVEERCVLDVHKIQFILAATENHKELGQELLKGLNGFRNRFTIQSEEELLQTFARPSRFDPPETVFVKQMLQWVLPQEIRAELTSELFVKYVTRDEADFADTLYMLPSHLSEMIGSGMEVGGHGYNHRWLGKLSLAEQAEELRRTVSFLHRTLGVRPCDWTMCYPFGSYNAETTELLRGMGCALGLTTRVGLAHLSQPLELERLDTNDIPTFTDHNVLQKAQINA